MQSILAELSVFSAVCSHAIAGGLTEPVIISFRQNAACLRYTEDLVNSSRK